MGKVEIAMAKLAAIQKAVDSALNEVVATGGITGSEPQYRRFYEPDAVGAYFTQAAQHLQVLRDTIPDWYADFHSLATEPDVKMAAGPHAYSPDSMRKLSRDIGQIMEIRANSEHAMPMATEPLRRAFVSHGRSKDWLEVQVYVEKDVNLATLELAQEASTGYTVIEKLEEKSALCDSAVIVMSGDDVDAAGNLRARENVMHEIGYFQGKYGRRRVILLHEEGVSVPTNLAGIVYVPYPKATVSACFAVLHRELTAMYR